MSTHLSNNYSQKRFPSTRKFAADAIKAFSKRTIQKIVETTCDLIGNEIADEITNVSKKSSRELHSQNEDEIEIPKERYISPEKRQWNINNTYQSRGVYNTNSDIRCKTTMLKSSLCDYSDAYILIKGTIAITGAGADAPARPRMKEINL